MDSIQQMMGSLVDHVSDVANSKAVTGEPIQLGDVKIVVLSMLSGGMGTGGGTGHGDPAAKRRFGQASDGVGEGAGGAVKVRPAAVIAFTPSGVKVLTIPGQPGVLDKVVEKVPDMVEMVEQARHAME